MLSYIFEIKVVSPSASWSELNAGIAGRCDVIMHNIFQFVATTLRLRLKWNTQRGLGGTSFQLSAECLRDVLKKRCDNVPVTTTHH